MKTDEKYKKVILGLKIKLERQRNKFSFAQFSKKTGLSVSYLNEIEKGKKYPREDKIIIIANTLGVNPEELSNLKLEGQLEPIEELIKMNFLDELPLGMFSLDISKVIDIMAHAPAKVGAFVSALVRVSKFYNIAVENFYLTALRAYLEFYDNYFEELEEKTEEFRTKFKLNKNNIDSKKLASILKKEYHYSIIKGGLEKYKSLSNLRSLYLYKRFELLLKKDLTEGQSRFLFGKELGFNYLKLSPRSYSSSILDNHGFNEILNHYKAGYFSTALLISKKEIIKDISKLFNNKKWNPDDLTDLLKKYNISPEILYQRFTNIVPQEFGFKEVYFSRFILDKKTGLIKMDRSFKLGGKFNFIKIDHGNHLCKKKAYVSELAKMNGQSKESIISKVQILDFKSSDNEYLTFSLIRNNYPSKGKASSVVFGIKINKAAKDKIKLLEDKLIPKDNVNLTCENCEIRNCNAREAQPILLEERRRKSDVISTIDNILK